MLTSPCGITSILFSDFPEINKRSPGQRSIYKANEQWRHDLEMISDLSLVHAEIENWTLGNLAGLWKLSRLAFPWQTVLCTYTFRLFTLGLRENWALDTVIVPTHSTT